MNDRTERETAQPNYKHQYNYNIYDMTMIKSIMENLDNVTTNNRLIRIASTQNIYIM